jgi:hypothetical protein
MDRKYPVLAIVLSLTFLTALPGGFLANVRAVRQTDITPWSPFGPRVTTLIDTVQFDINSEQNLLQSGGLDIMDAPLQPSAIQTFPTNPDIFVSDPQAQLFVFDLQINNHAPFLGVVGEVNRTIVPPGIIGTPTRVPGCSTGFGRLVVNLVNQEERNTPVKDSLNLLTVTGPQTFAVTDSGGSAPNGTYVVPTSSTCLLAGTYTLSSTVYAGSDLLFVGSGQIITLTFGINYNSPSTVKPTLASIEIRRGLAHLLDKPNFVRSDGSLRGQATCNDIFASPAQGLGFGSCNPLIDGVPRLPQSVLDEDLADHPWTSALGINHEVSAYNLQSDLIAPTQYWWASTGASIAVGAGYSGINDLRAACDHFVVAGFTVTPSGKTCQDVANAAQGTTPQPGYPHLVASSQVIFYIRTDPPRRAFGQIFADSINFLFGTANNGAILGAIPTNVPCAVNYGFKSAAPGCATKYYTIGEIANTIFGDGLNPDTWNLYTGGYFLRDVPDQFYTIMHSKFAGKPCGGIPDQFINNYYFHCDPAYDTQSAAGQFSSTLSQANSFFANAATIGYRTVMDIPVYSSMAQFAALNAWSWQGTTHSSLVAGTGNGWGAGSPGAFFSLANMRCNPSSVPVFSSDQCGGGTPNLIRRGLSEDINLLNPFLATTARDFDVINEVFDTMLKVNPLTGGGNSQVIDWMTTTHTSTFNPGEISCVPGGSCVVGTTTQIWHLRNDLSFHDGVRVTADDVVYTMIADRDVPSAEFQPNVASVASAIALDSSTVEVKLQHQSYFYQLDIGLLPILPAHVWKPLCGSIVNGSIPGAPISKCADPTFDPMASGIFIGSSAFECVVPNGFPNAGHIGGSCVVNNCGPPGTQCLGGQTIVSSGGVRLTRYDGFDRCCPGQLNSSLYRLSWADHNNDGVVNILDIADVAFHFGQPDPYWVNPIIAPDSTVSITDVATVAFYFGHGTTSPFLPFQLTALDPCIDPFFQSSPPC